MRWKVVFSGLASAIASDGRQPQFASSVSGLNITGRVNPAWDTSRMVGAEYTPWRASNELWWHDYKDYRADVVRELKLAKEVMGFTTLRMFLHSMLYADDPDGLKANMADFLDICEQEGFTAGFVFFDDCWNHGGADLDKPCIPRKGLHNACWMASPQDVERTDVNRFQSYVSDIVKSFAEDARVAWWEIFNEPKRGNEFTMSLRHAAFGWAKAQNPTQPVISCWDDSDDTEIVDHHQYNNPWGADNAVFSNPAKGGIVTEAGARWYQKTNKDAGSPLTVLNWLTALKKNGGSPFIPGVMIDWEVMVGHSQTRWHWGDAEGIAEPPIPWHNHIYPDGTPVSFTEAAATRRYMTGVDEFVFVETFLDTEDPASDEKYLTLSPGQSFSSKGVGAAEGMFELTFWHEGSQSAALTQTSCSYIGEAKDFAGSDVKHTTYTGNTDEEKDASCCSSCEQEPACEYWVRATDTSDCWLKASFTGFSGNDKRRGNFNLKSCSYIGENKDFVGSDVKKTTYEGTTDEEKDASCCSQCYQEPQCDYWVRATDSNQCWLKRAFAGFKESGVRRGNFKNPLSGDKLSFHVAGTYTVTVDPYKMSLTSSAGELASFNVMSGTPEGGIIMKSWNMLRVLVQNNRVRVWLNPQFSDVTGASVPPADEQSLKAMPARIDAAVQTQASGGDIVISTPNDNNGNIRVDYVSVLPPKLYGLAAAEEIAATVV